MLQANVESYKMQALHVCYLRATVLIISVFLLSPPQHSMHWGMRYDINISFIIIPAKCAILARWQNIIRIVDTVR